MLSPQELRVFLEAADTENFSEAARRLGISQPAVSMAIKALEDRLGLDLFERRGRAVRLTDAGHALVPRARDLGNRLISLEEEMASLHGDVVGLLKIACTTTAGKYVLPPLMAGLQHIHPQVRLVCNVVPREVAVAQIAAGEGQIGLASDIDTRRTLEFRAFLEDRIVLITPPDHPWVGRDGPVRVDELPGASFIAREDGAGTSLAVREALAEHGVGTHDLNASMVFGNSEAIRMAVQEGLGVAFVSAMVAKDGYETGKVAVVPVTGLDITKTLYLFRNPEVPATRAAAAFWDFAFAPENEEIRRRPSRLGSRG
jgi:DNA-binding transcriptional LysR family regulator